MTYKKYVLIRYQSIKCKCMIHIGIPIGMEEVPKEMSLDRIMETKMVG